MIIGFCGYQHAGKDTAGAYLIKDYGFERKSFADPMKRSIAALFGIEFWEVEEFKNDPNIKIQLVRESDLGEDEIEIITDLTMRRFQQEYGTKSHREALANDIWVDLTLPVGGYYAGRKIVITDVRFGNEVDRIHLLGGVVVRIRRESIGTTSNDLMVTTHISEQPDGLNFDFTIDNDGTIDDLYRQIDNLLVTILKDIYNNI